MAPNPSKTSDPCARDYDEHARNLHSRATAAHVEWLASMSPGERQRVKALHLDAPPDDDNEVGGHSPYSLNDIADTPLARIDPDFALEIDQPHEILAEEFGLTSDQARQLLTWHAREVTAAVDREKANYLQLIVGGLLSSKNPKLNAAGLAFAAGLAALNGLPCQREYARQNHVSAQAVSKVVTGWQRALNLRPSAHQKSAQACETYSHVGKTRHWRARPITATSAAALLSRLRPANKPDTAPLN